MQNPKYGDGRNLCPVVWKGFIYILSHPYGNLLFWTVLVASSCDMLTVFDTLKISDISSFSKLTWKYLQTTDALCINHQQSGFLVEILA